MQNFTSKTNMYVNIIIAINPVDSGSYLAIITVPGIAAYHVSIS